MRNVEKLRTFNPKLKDSTGGEVKKLRELWQFQNLAYFLTWWPSFVTYLIVQVTCKNQWPSTYMDPIWWWFVKAFVNYAWKCANFV